MESGSLPPECALRRHRGGSVPAGWMIFCAAVLFCTVLTTGCARTKLVSETIYKDNRIRIRLVQKLDKEKKIIPQGYEQPWDVDTETLDAVLGSIRFRRMVVFVKGKSQPAFPNPQRLLMLKPLQEAFAKAGPNQWVDFSFEHERKWLIISRDQLTNGVLFRKDGKLNCAFRNLAFEYIDDPEGTAVPYQGNPTEEPVRNDWVLVLEPGQKLKKIDDPGFMGPKQFPNWIQIDLAKKWEAPDDEGAAKLKEEEAAVEKKAADRSDLPTTEEIDKQMEFLEELHKEGAISDNAYNQKKMELEKIREMLNPPPAK